MMLFIESIVGIVLFTLIIVTMDGHWKTPAEIPVRSPESEKMTRDMKKRGISYMGPVITYSFIQSIGMVNDHLIDCSYR